MSKHQTQRERVSVKVCGEGGGRRSPRGHGEEKLFWRRPDLTEPQPSVTNAPVLEGEKNVGVCICGEYLAVPECSWCVVQQLGGGWSPGTGLGYRVTVRGLGFDEADA